MEDVRSRPHVVVHVAVSLDGATSGFDVDLGVFYRLAATWSEDLTLTGADTILAQETALAEGPRPGPAPEGPVLAVVDGRARVSQWDALRDAGYWSDVIALHAGNTPARPPHRAVREIVTGTDRVDLAEVLTRLWTERDVGVVRVDSGGRLIGGLLDAGLIDELSLLVHPIVAGASGAGRWYGTATGSRSLTLQSAAVQDDGVVWLRHTVDPMPPG